jgi:5-formyltetrahydrofolate cyclo-ligase
MVFCDCKALDESCFKTGAFGIMEPLDSLAAVEPETIDIVVLPAVAYNEEGTRLGMGGGFYDRYIGDLGSDRPYLLGICYEFQICSDVPGTDNDISADFIAVIPEEEYGE